MLIQLKHNLLFERFLNPERISMPDIDIDFPDHRRDEVINMWQKNMVKCMLHKSSHLEPSQQKRPLRDVGKVFGLNNKEIEQLSKNSRID